MNKKFGYSLALLFAAALMASCNDSNNQSKEQNMDTNYLDTRRNTTDTMQTLPDTARMKVDTFQQQSQGQQQAPQQQQ